MEICILLLLLLLKIVSFANKNSWARESRLYKFRGISFRIREKEGNINRYEFSVYKWKFINGTFPLKLNRRSFTQCGSMSRRVYTREEGNLCQTRQPLLKLDILAETYPRMEHICSRKKQTEVGNFFRDGILVNQSREQSSKRELLL